MQFFCLAYNAMKREREDTPWKKRFGEQFEPVLITFGAEVEYKPPPETRLGLPKLGPKTRFGIYLGPAHYAGGRVGPEHYCMALSQLENLNMKSGRL